MINREATRGTGPKTTATPTRTKATKEEGAPTAVKSKGKAEVSARGDVPQGGTWHGDEVSPSPLTATSAEAAAARAEGNEPIRADVEARDPDHGTYPTKGPARRPRADDPDADENAEEKRQSAAEEHAAMPSRHFPHGKL